MHPIFVASTIFLAIQISASHLAFPQSPIVLRDLTLIRDKTISNFDRSAITLSDGSTLQWDEVLQAQLADGDQGTELSQRQSEFDDFIKQIGLPLFRVKTRIQQGDWAGAGKIAGPVFDSVASGSSTFANPNVEYLICLATMKSRIGQGSSTRNRAGAVIPFLRALSVQPNVDQATLALVGTQRMADEREDVLSPDLLPVWFDIGQTRFAAAKIKQLADSKENRDAEKPADVAMAIYLASMQIELGQNDAANANLNRLKGRKSKPIESWLTVLNARMLLKAGEHVKAQAMLDRNSENIVGDARPVAIYYRGLSEFELHNTKPDRPLNSVVDIELSKSSLMLMRLPAFYGESHPDLAASGLYQVAKIAKLRGQADQSKKLSRELLQRYPRTYHGNLKPIVADAR